MLTLIFNRHYLTSIDHHENSQSLLEVSTGPGRMRAGPGRAGPNLSGPGRAERFSNLLGIRAGFLQSFTRKNFLTN